MPPPEKKKEEKILQTPSKGNPPSTNDLNTELNNVARNTDNVSRALWLIEQGADIKSYNGETWRTTPLHQACYHGRYEMAKMFAELQVKRIFLLINLRTPVVEPAKALLMI